MTSRWTARLLHPWDFPGKSTGMGCHCLLRTICISSVQFSRSVVSNSLRPHESQHARPPCPSPTPGVYLLKLMTIQSVMPSSHLILFRPLLLLPPIPPSIRVFSNASTLRMRWKVFHQILTFQGINAENHDLDDL